MKTIADLNALIPTLCELLANNDHDFGSTYMEQDECGYGKCHEYETNYFTYDEDGWMIEVSYECCGEFENDPGDYWTPPCYDLIKGWGKVSEITVSHYDEETDEETDFDDADLEELKSAFDKILEDIA